MSAFDCIWAVQSNQQLEITTDPRAEIRAFINEHLPHAYMRCGGNLKNGKAKWSSIKAREKALVQQWISFNTTDYWNAQIVDCDHDEWPHYLKRLREQGQPEPTYIVVSPSGTAHILWYYTDGKAKISPDMRRMHEGINEYLRASLCGDIHFKQYLTKNPLHEAYEVVQFTGNTYDFSDFLPAAIEFSGDDYVLAPKWHYQITGSNPNKQPAKRDLAADIGPKGSRVWEIGHRRVHRRRSADYTIIHSIYEDVALELGSPITPKALAGMAKRSVRWMLAHPNMLGQAARDMRDIDIGVMRRDAIKRNELVKWNALGLTAKRVAAAERTNGIRKNSTQNKLHDAIARLWHNAIPITQVALKQESGLSLRYIKKCWNDFVADYTDGASRSNPFSIEDGRALLASLAALAGESLTLSEVSDLSKARAARIKHEKVSIPEYMEQAERLKKRCATPETVKPRGVDASPELKVAHETSLAALKDCNRRADARSDRKMQKLQANQRKDQFLQWAMDDDFEAYKAFLKQESSYWNELQDAVANNMDSKKKVIVRRGAAFNGYSKLWESCCSLADRKRSMRKRRYCKRDNDAAQVEVFDDFEIMDLPFALSTNYTGLYHNELLE